MAREVVVKDVDYTGKYRQYWNYVNEDSSLHKGSCCGQAAVYSVLRTINPKKFTGSFQSFVEKNPPNMLFGTLGTSRERILQTFRKHGFKASKGEYETPLRIRLLHGPVVVCLDVGATGDYGKGIGGWGLHWVAVFGYTHSHYQITNWNGGTRLSHEKFRKAWNTSLTSAAAWSSCEYYYPH